MSSKSSRRKLSTRTGYGQQDVQSFLADINTAASNMNVSGPSKKTQTIKEETINNSILGFIPTGGSNRKYTVGYKGGFSNLNDEQINKLKASYNKRKEYIRMKKSMPGQSQTRLMDI